MSRLLSKAKYPPSVRSGPRSEKRKDVAATVHVEGALAHEK
jgi:hypothetical protein